MWSCTVIKLSIVATTLKLCESVSRRRCTVLMPLARRGTSTGLLQSDHSINSSPSTCTRTTQRHAVMATEAEATRSRQKTIKPKYMSFSFAQGQRACGGALSNVFVMCCVACGEYVFLLSVLWSCVYGAGGVCVADVSQTHTESPSASPLSTCKRESRAR